MKPFVEPDIALHKEIIRNVTLALAEDIGDADLTALLLPADRQATATIISREDAILCGVHWFDACFLQLAPASQITRFAQDGERIAANQTLYQVTGNARSLLSAERTALNFLQTLSAVATRTRQYVEAISGTNAVIVDTRKTLPGLRLAQKYAVSCGGGTNHRLGLYDGILIKENHIIASGGIAQAVRAAQHLAPPDTFIEVEVETLDELQQAIDAGARMILLDNFDAAGLRACVATTRRQAGDSVILEASGGVTLANVREIAETGVHRISVGSLTKDIRAIDLSMRFTLETPV